jgi:RNA polymerase sigma factor (sigma-70 family)
MTDREKQIISIIAKQTSRRWNTIEFEDLFQHLVLFYYEGKIAFDNYRNHPQGEGSFRVAINREALKYAENETKHFNKMLIEDGYTYTSNHIENALPFLYEDVMTSLSTSVMENPLNGAPVSRYHDTDYNKALVIMMDLQIAYDKLTQEEQETLELRFKDELSLKEMASIFNITPQGVSLKVGRIIKKIQRLIG